MKTIFIFLIKAAERRTLSAAAGKIKKEAPGLLWFLPPFYLLFEALPEKMTQKNCRRGSYFFALLTILTSRIIFSRSFSPSISAPLEISTPYG